ncbi:MAG: putative sensor protein [Frankiales bacterium]|nr:putative sensor protein [Frankiales bacterium]
MAERVAAAAVRRASGLPDVEVLRTPDRLARVRALVALLPTSPVLPGLVALAARVAGTEHAQLSLLAGEQAALAVRLHPLVCATGSGPLEDSLCTVTVLSGDVLVVGDARTHPWLHDLPPVQSDPGVGCYLGVPLALADGTQAGALCVHDDAPRAWAQEQVGLVCDVADVVALELQRLDDGRVLS